MKDHQEPYTSLSEWICVRTAVECVRQLKEREADLAAARARIAQLKAALGRMIDCATATLDNAHGLDRWEDWYGALEETRATARAALQNAPEMPNPAALSGMERDTGAEIEPTAAPSGTQREPRG